MWNNAGGDGFGGGGGGGGGGGFMNTTFSSPSANKTDKEHQKAQNIVPVTIKQLWDCTEDHLKIDNMDVNTIVILGIVRRVETATTKVTFTIDDGTGQIDAIQYVGTDEGPKTEPQTILLEGTYGRIVGGLRSQRGGGTKYINIFKVFPMRNVNEITVHALEVLEIPIKLKRIREMEAQKTGVGAAGMNNTYSTTSMVGGGFVPSVGAPAPPSNSVSGLTNSQNKLLNFITSCPSQDGASRFDIEKQLNLPSSQLNDLLEKLSGEGLIYATIDEDHFKATD